MNENQKYYPCRRCGADLLELDTSCYFCGLIQASEDEAIDGLIKERELNDESPT